MRKTFNILFCTLALLLVITACSNDDKQSDQDHLPPTHEQPNDETPDGEQPNGEPNGDESGDEPSDGQPDGEQPNGEPNGDEPGDEPSGEPGEATSDVQRIVENIFANISPRETMEITEDMLADWYHLDAAWLAEYAIHAPMFNISASEFAVLQVQDEHMQDVLAALEQRAQDVQKQFEEYLPNQYENAQNYEVITHESFVLFVIDEPETKATIIDIFESHFE